MQFTNFLLAAAATSGAMALHPRALTTGSYSNTTTTASVYVTQTVTAYETYCPKKTVFHHGHKTYTGQQNQWVTVTDCTPACTISNLAGAQPSVVPVGMNPKYNNGTAPAVIPCPCSAANAAANNAGSCSCPSSSTSNGNSGSGSSNGANQGAGAGAGAGSNGANNGANQGSGSNSGSASPSGSNGNGPVQANGGNGVVVGQAAAALAVIGGVAFLL